MLLYRLLVLLSRPRGRSSVGVCPTVGVMVRRVLVDVFVIGRCRPGDIGVLERVSWLRVLLGVHVRSRMRLCLSALLFRSHGHRAWCCDPGCAATAYDRPCEFVLFHQQATALSTRGRKHRKRRRGPRRVNVVEGQGSRPSAVRPRADRRPRRPRWWLAAAGRRLSRFGLAWTVQLPLRRQNPDLHSYNQMYQTEIEFDQTFEVIIVRLLPIYLQIRHAVIMNLTSIVQQNTYLIV
jgi:hypothetical protein